MLPNSQHLVFRKQTLDRSKVMTSLLELLYAYPVLENLVAALPLGDLFNLSKTNSTVRAVLHGFLISSPQKPSSRPILYIGRHNTLQWKNLKAKSPLCCSEPQHTKGNNVKGCLGCSMPICEACIIKASFGKRDEKTFPNRTRSLCVECFDSGNPHQEASLKGEGNVILTSYHMRTECICTARDGHLCLRCKTKQNQRLDIRNNQCYGTGCSKSRSDGFGGRICLWCDLPLPPERSKAESRRDYDARHLLARTHSSYDRPTEEVAEDDIIDPAEQEAIWASSPFSASEMTTSQKQAKAAVYDRFEDERRRELERVSERRQFTVSASEEERWRRSETLRRSESMCRAPPPKMIQGPSFSLGEAETVESRSASTASTLPPEDDDSSLPSYHSSVLGSSQSRL